MHYLIDGYNLFFFLFKKFQTLQKKREDIIQKLSHDIDIVQLKATIIFDSHHNFSQEFASKYNAGPLEIIFSPSNRTADDYIIELLLFHHNPKNITVVTSDRLLSKEIRSHGALSINVEDFVCFLEKSIKRKTTPHPLSKNEEMSSWDFARFLKAFQRPLSDTENEEL